MFSHPRPRLQVEFPPFKALIMALINDGTVLTISTECVLPSNQPDSWDLNEIYAYALAYGLTNIRELFGPQRVSRPSFLVGGMSTWEHIEIRRAELEAEPETSSNNERPSDAEVRSSQQANQDDPEACQSPDLY